MAESALPFQVDVDPLYRLVVDRSVDLPGRDELQAAIHLLFWVSLERDEDRPVTGSFVFTSQSECPHSLCFKKRIAFNDVGAIRRIAMAADPDTSALAIHAGEIWGIALTLPVAGLFLTIVEPGRILVRHGTIGVIGSFSRGALNVFDSSPTALSLADIQKRHDLPDEVFQFLSAQSAWMRRLRHGGAIIVSADDAREHIGDDFDLVHELVDFELARNWADKTAAEAKLELDPDNAEIRNQVELERLQRDTAEHRLAQNLARLSHIDGAVLVDRNLNVLAFGAKIRVRTKECRVRRLRLGEGEQLIELAELGGTRHQSAASYAMERPGSVALVVSQDGTLSLISCSDARAVVLATTNFEPLIPLNATSLSFGVVAHVRA
jgi:hypothetical protein